MRRVPYSSFILVCLAIGSVHEVGAAPWTGSATYQACVGAANGNDSAIAACGQAEFERADKLLNIVYADRLKKAEGKLKEAIKTAQKLWLAARDPTCDAESLVYEGGTFENVSYTECEARLTSERIDWLKRFDQ